MFNNITNALVICPHTDDELGCAGLIIRLVENGCDVHYIAMSKCEEALPPSFSKNTLVKECYCCTVKLGIPSSNVEILEFPVHNFPSHRQRILVLLLQINNIYRPDLVIVPSSFDTNQDHATVYQESFRVFKHTSIIGYEHPQNMTTFNNSLYVTLTEEQMEAKVDAMSDYESQKDRVYMSPDYIYSLARVRGMQCNSTYAESFEVIRWIA